MSAATQADNLRGALLMVLAMAGFAFEDMFIKLMAEHIPTGQIIALIGLGGGLIFAAMVLARGEPLFNREMLSAPVLIRLVGEAVGSLCFVTAIVLIPLSTASAIIQTTPLVVTLGAALFLGETVGWRRWSAILVGLFGVILVIRPGMTGFDSNALFAVVAVLGLALRDLATRRVAPETSTLQLSYMAFLALVPTGAALMLFGPEAGPVAPTGREWLLLGGSLIAGSAAYYGIVAAMRVGEVSFVTPFRYSRLLFAAIIGGLIFDEWPDLFTLLGGAIIIASGVYTFLRERRLSRRSAWETPPLA